MHFLVERKRRTSFQLENAPDVNSIKDLIEIGKSIKFYKNIDTIMLWRIRPHLEDLESLIGMGELKDTLFHQILYYVQGMHTRNKNEEYLHTVLCGAPGSGKTSVAMVIGRIYQEMGVLSRNGPFKVAHRDDFIAGYLGQTAIKTTNLLKSCIGGVLFIDEVYSMGSKDSDKDSYAKEALDTLTAFLSEHKNDFCCIVAGYEKDIDKCFFAKNEGLRRRFQWVHRIQEYSHTDLARIFIKMVYKIKWEVLPEEQEIATVIQSNKELFLYAGGDIENMLTKCKMAHSKRVFSLDKKHKFVLTIEDLENAIISVKKNKKPEKTNDPPPGMYT